MIKLDHVSKSFGQTEAVKDLSLEVKQGEIFGFLGPNGAGKSTTIRLITGILTPDHGTITVNHLPLTKKPEEVKKITAYIPDDPFVYRYLSGREFLTFVGTVYGLSARETRRRITHLLKLFPTIDDVDGPFYTYSRGTRQKLVFMAGMLHDPHLYVIDEPMVGLDPQSARVVKDILKQAVREHGATVFLSTHTLSVAEELCDRVGIINQGRLTAVGTMIELRHLAHRESGDLEEIFLALT